MTLGTKIALGQAKIDIGGPCPKPLINVRFWCHFLRSRGAKTYFGAENSDFNGKFCYFLCSGAIRVVLGGPETLIFL